jgi:hypothetical protein
MEEEEEEDEEKISGRVTKKSKTRLFIIFEDSITIV